jgi:hypothetical protein
MTDKYPDVLNSSLADGDYEESFEISPDEVEVRLAIAEYVIKRVNGTPEGREIFNGLIKRFENKYPHHKLLAHCLTSPGHIELDDLEE